MAIYLVQHGKSHPKDVDPERKLNEEGKAEVRRIADVAGKYGIHVRGIKHSGKTRSQETAEIFGEALNPESGIEAIDGLGAKDDVTHFAKFLSAYDKNMYVGHLPFMEKLTAFLVSGDSDRLVVKFQNGGIVCLDRADSSNQWYIKWTLMPHID